MLRVKLSLVRAKCRAGKKINAKTFPCSSFYVLLLQPKAPAAAFFPFRTKAKEKSISQIKMNQISRYLFEQMMKLIWRDGVTLLHYIANKMTPFWHRIYLWPEIDYLRSFRHWLLSTNVGLTIFPRFLIQPLELSSVLASYNSKLQHCNISIHQLAYHTPLPISKPALF